MTQDQNQPIVVNLPEGQNTLTLLSGQAPKQLDQQAPVRMDASGIIDSLTADIKTAQADCDRLDAELREQMKHSQAYKDFEQAVKETTDSTDSTDF